MYNSVVDLLLHVFVCLFVCLSVCLFACCMQLMYMHLAKSANPLDAVYGPDLSCTVLLGFR